MRPRRAEPWEELGRAILVRAWKDAHEANGAKAAREAGLPAGVSLAADGRAFLNSDGAAWLTLALDIDPAVLERARAALPPPEYEQMALSL